jgi:hypothetical protein
LEVFEGRGLPRAIKGSLKGQAFVIRAINPSA